MKKRKPVEERKEEVFFAIAHIIAEKGLSEVSTTEVAKRLGVSQPAIYKYFKNKDQMLVYFISHIKQQLENILNKAQTGKNTIQKLKILYEHHFELIEKTKILPRVIFSDEIHLGDPEKRKALASVIDLYKEGIKSILQEGIKKGEIKKIDVEIGANLIMGFIISCTLNWMLQGMNYSLRKKAQEVTSQLSILLTPC
ncbi:MAG: TetR/AcrR family transcriptional regulator [Aquificae bacterium]|nr:TetR/AcrR family transcriptional regulator [Aquificota bacterium]